MPKKSKYTAVFLLIDNETQCVSLFCFSSRFMTYAPYSILGKLCLEKTPETRDSTFQVLNDGMGLKVFIHISPSYSSSSSSTNTFYH